MSQRLGQAFKRWWSGGPFSEANDTTHRYVVAECAYRAGYLAACRYLAGKEEKSRRACSKAEACVASQVALGGLAGVSEMTAEESVKAIADLIEATDAAALKRVGKRRVA